MFLLRFLLLIFFGGSLWRGRIKKFEKTMLAKKFGVIIWIVFCLPPTRALILWLKRVYHLMFLLRFLLLIFFGGSLWRGRIKKFEKTMLAKKFGVIIWIVFCLPPTRALILWLKRVYHLMFLLRFLLLIFFGGSLWRGRIKKFEKTMLAKKFGYYLNLFLLPPKGLDPMAQKRVPFGGFVMPFIINLFWMGFVEKQN